MRVDSYGKLSSIYNVNNTRKSDFSKKNNLRGDTFEISQKAKTFQLVKNTVSSASDIRVDRVEKLRQAVEEGSYSVSARDIANKLVDSYYQ